ncbi:MAG: NAD(P)H-hydrate dehydratase [Planctomycetaceae bacterium]|nr:NAD(P)H-hydrate dehydratase [Planctomycetaceae bacterium]
MQRITELPKLAVRAADSHKGMFGRVLVVGGSVGFSGAVAMAARSALRSGAGLVCAAAPESVLPIVAALDPCYTTAALNEDANGQISMQAVNSVLQLAKENDVTAFGPGAGTGPGVSESLSILLNESELKLVIDADGLNVLAANGGVGGWHTRKKAQCILTPHPGEMQRLWNSVFRDAMPSDREQCAVQFAQKTEAIIVLKGNRTVVTDSEKVYTNISGNPGMATGGSGDVLTGVIAALIGQGLSLFDAAVLGVYVHGRAGDLAADEFGQVSLIATDIIEKLPAAFKSLR